MTHDATHKHIGDIITALGLNHLTGIGEATADNTYPGLIITLTVDTDEDDEENFALQYLFTGIQHNPMVYSRRLGITPNVAQDESTPWDHLPQNMHPSYRVKDHLEEIITNIGWRGTSIELPETRPFIRPVQVTLNQNLKVASTTHAT